MRLTPALVAVGVLLPGIAAAEERARGDHGAYRYFVPSHEASALYGATGLLVGSDAHPQLLGVGYEEHAGLLGEGIAYDLPRLVGIQSGGRPRRSQFGTYVDLRAYLPLNEDFAYGGEGTLGMSFRVGRFGHRGPFSLLVALRIGFLSHAGKQAAMDAISVRFVSPITRHASAWVQFDANLYAVLPYGRIAEWYRPSPLTVGAQYDLDEVFVAGEAAFVWKDATWAVRAGRRF